MVAIALGLLARDLNVAFLVGLAFAVAASANLPALLYSLFWRGFTTRGAVWAVYGGLIPALVLVVLSPVVSGSPESLFPGVDFQYFPLENPGLVSIPLGFLAGWLGTVTSRRAAGRGQARGDRGAVAHGRGGRLTAGTRRPSHGTPARPARSDRTATSRAGAARPGRRRQARRRYGDTQA